MKLASSDGIGFRERQAFRLLRARKRLRQFLRYRRFQDKTVCYVVGCQRSGTSMAHHLLRLDLDTVTYDEVSPLSVGDTRQQLRWTSLELVRERITADRAPLVAAKPLVESQNLTALLDLFPATRALWMYRHFADVAASNVQFFGDGTGHDDLRPILAGDESDWRAEHLAAADVATLRDLYRPDLPPHDAAALFWWVRNSLYFSRGLDRDPRVRVCRYADLVSRPGAVMRAVYAFLERPYPGDRIVRDVFSGSRGRGRDLPLAPPVRALCQGMLDRLDAAPRLGAE